MQRSQSCYCCDSRTEPESVYRLVLGMRGWACLALICHQQNGVLLQMSLVMLACRKARHFRLPFRVSYVWHIMFIVEVDKPVFSPCTHDDGWLCLSSRAKSFTLQWRHGRFVGDSSFLTEQKKLHHHLQQVQSLIPHNYIACRSPPR